MVYRIVSLSTFLVRCISNIVLLFYLASPTEYPWVSSPFERVENRIEEDEEEEEQEVASLDGQDLQFHWGRHA